MTEPQLWSIPEGCKSAPSWRIYLPLKPGHAHRGVQSEGCGIALSHYRLPPLSLLHPSPIPAFHFSGNGNILLRPHMHKHTLIPGVHWPILRGCVRPMRRSPGRSCRGVGTRSHLVGSFRPGLSWMLWGFFVFLFFCCSWNGWEMGLEVWGGEVNKEESVK